MRSDERQFPAEDHRHRCQSLTQLWINLNPRALLCHLDSSYHGSGCEEGRKARCRAAQCWAALSEGFSFLIWQQNDSYAMRLLPLFLLATGASATCQRDPRGGGNLGRSKNFLPVIVKKLKICIPGPWVRWSEVLLEDLQEGLLEMLSEAQLLW